MKLKAMLMRAVPGLIFALSQAVFAQQSAREVTVTAIPGIVAAGAKWTLAWQGTDNADGIGRYS